MPRKFVQLVTGETYHIFNRGVDKRTVFIDQEDYLRFFNTLQHFNSVEPAISLYESIRSKKDTCGSNKLVEIHAYCCIPNHFHLLLTQSVDQGISEFMKRVSGGYTSYFNEKYGRSGSLFQGTYKRINIEKNEKLVHLSAYINYNHTVHNLDGGGELYKSSRGAYIGKSTADFISTRVILEQFKSKEEYEKSASELALSIRDTRNTERNLLYAE